jgi:serine/threonine-protein kinase
LIRQQHQSIEGYELVRELGKGAMGVVYAAINQFDQSVVALKLIVPHVVPDEQDVARFVREAEILRELRHPNIVGFRDAGESNGRLYYTMEFVRGADAYEICRGQGRLPVGRAVRLVCQLLEALAYAHDRKFVHREIKPANVLVTNSNGLETTKLADFGIARMYQTSRISGLTLTGVICGTPLFIAPEQITHFRDSKPPVDQYAAGGTLYYLLTGQYPHGDEQSSAAEMLLMKLEKDYVPILSRRNDLPQDLVTAIDRSLRRAPAERFPSVSAMRDAISPFANTD